MAEPSLIDAYLTELRSTMARTDNIDDVIEELRDHLEASVECAMDAGADRASAEAAALVRFGSPSVVARVFAEERKRGGAVSTRLTRRAGLAAMLAPPLLLGGMAVAGASSSQQPGSGIGVTMSLVGVALLVFALIGLRARHGGLGWLGRVGFWWAIAALPLAMPFGWAGFLVLAVELGGVVVLLGTAMLRAAILPRVAVAVFAFTWPAWAPIAWVITQAGDDANRYLAIPILTTLLAFMFLGRVLWREPALDVRTTGGPLAA